MKLSKFLNVGIVVLIGVLVYLLGYPQVKKREEKEKEYQVLVNMYAFRVGVENYIAYNQGKIPQCYEEIKKFLPEIINPYTGEEIEENGVVFFKYTEKNENKNQSPEGKNGRIKGEPGGLGYGYFLPEGDSIPIEYGIVGFDSKGETLREKILSGEEKVYVLYE